jgi:nucleotide-binding universal stress UspA family protein
MNPRVVVGYDQTPPSALAIEEAAAEAEWRSATLVVIHAYDRPLSGTGATALRIAEQGAERARLLHPGLEVRALASAGAVPAVLTEFGRDADLLVVGHRGQGRLSQLVLDSVAVRLAVRPTCPTMVVRRRGLEPRGTILAAIDLEDAVDGVLTFAFDEARLRRASLEAISVREAFWPRVYAGDPGVLRAAAIQAADKAALALEHMLKLWQDVYPDVHVRHELVDGSPGGVLTAAASHADLIVAGAHHHGTGGLPVGDAHIGTTINPLLLRADCPVVITPRD